jgi:hypothetical protein
VTNGAVLSEYNCDGGTKTAVLVRVNIPAKGSVTVGIPDNEGPATGGGE